MAATARPAIRMLLAVREPVLSVGERGNGNEGFGPILETREVNPAMRARTCRKVSPDCIRTVPELATRPNLIELMNSWPGFRRAVLNTIDRMWNIACIPDAPFAVEMLDLYWKRAVKPRLTSWHNKFDCTPTIHESHVLWAECSGLLRNVYRNVGLSLGRKQGFKWNEHDVVREFER